MKRKKLTALLLCIALTVSIFSNLSFGVAALEINSLENSGFQAGLLYL